MGNALSKLLDWLNASPYDHARVVMLGLDNSGKTTILYKLKDSGNGVPRTVPTMGFNVETVTFTRVSFTVWDVGGQNRLRPLWSHYLKGAHALIYIIDSSDRERMTEAAHEFQLIINHRDMQDCPALVFANKQDVDGRMEPLEVCRHLDLGRISSDIRRWRVQGSVGIRGEGLHLGLDWLVSALKQQNKDANKSRSSVAGRGVTRSSATILRTSNTYATDHPQLPASLESYRKPTTVTPAPVGVTEPEASSTGMDTASASTFNKNPLSATPGQPAIHTKTSDASKATTISPC